MLHFFPHYAKDVSAYPFAIELRRLQVEHRFFDAHVPRRYKTIWGLLLWVYPPSIWSALRCAVWSLLLSRPRPTAVIIESDIEALVFGVLRRILRLQTLIVFQTLIITPRRSSIANALYQHYFALILSLVDIGICHSRAEIAHYAKAFPNARCQLVFVPYGTTVHNAEAALAEYEAAGRGGDVVTAGRSGRDYRTLVEAIQGLPCKLRILCDLNAPLIGIEPSEQIKLIRNCFGWAYIQALANAVFVVVPLAENDISAGQMALLHACALGKAVIVTRTATTPDYATDGEDALFVEMGDVGQMRAAVRRLLEEPALRERIGSRAFERFTREHSTEAFVRNLIAAIGTIRPQIAGGLQGS